MHHFLTAAGLLALIGFAFGARTARVVAAIAVAVPAVLFAALVVAVLCGYFE